MTDFFDSKFMKDLQAGKFPPMTIEFDILSVLILCACLFVTSILVIKVSKII